MPPLQHCFMLSLIMIFNLIELVLSPDRSLVTSKATLIEHVD